MVDYRKGLPGKPFDGNYGTDLLAFKMAQKILPELKGTNHIWGFRDKYGTIGIYPRGSQPCQGGEMRKYSKHSTGEILHGDLCTEPEKGKPGDLYAPFPSGNPVFVGTRLGVISGDNKELNNKTYETFWRDSVYGRLLNPQGENFHWNFDSEGNIIGFITTNTKVDPTVLVNAIQVFRDYGNAFSRYLDDDIHIDVAFLLVSLFVKEGSGSSLKFKQCPLGQEYHFTRSLNMKRYATGTPRDFRQDPSKGLTLFSGEDYNRTHVAELFECERGEKPYQVPGQHSLEDLVKIIERDIQIARGLARDQEETQEVKIEVQSSMTPVKAKKSNSPKKEAA